MPFYRNIDPGNEVGQRILERLLALREHLDREIPARSLDETLLLATWNIREFDSLAYGKRLPEAFYYIAEIIARFDLVAIQEVRKDLKPLETLLEILGGSWKYIASDVTEGSQGNEERIAFLYDSRKVNFKGIAGELVLPPIKLKDEDNKTIYQPVPQFARTPLICGFTAGWTRFMLCSVHILYGEGIKNDPRRIEEIRQVAQFLRKRTLDQYAWARNLILLGDFNIFDPSDETMNAILDAGFIIPEEFRELKSSASKEKSFDQIAFRVRQDSLTATGKAGVFDF
jgi:endonuclease/exonuclease/phosphatase family metal-dependent hydrolase